MGPSHPCCNSRSSPTYPSPLERKHESPSHIQWSPVSVSYLERRDPFPSWSGKNSRRSRRISRARSLHRKGERYSRVVPPFPESPDISVHSRETCFPALPRLSSQGSSQTTVARGTSLWESLVGKPRGKASRESQRSLDPREGKCDTASTTREESARAYPSRDED